MQLMHFLGKVQQVVNGHGGSELGLQLSLSRVAGVYGHQLLDRACTTMCSPSDIGIANFSRGQSILGLPPCLELYEAAEALGSSRRTRAFARLTQRQQ